MRLNRTRRAVAVAALAGCGVLGLTGSGASAAPVVHAKVATAPKAGAYVAHEGLVRKSNEPSAYAVDDSGFQHFAQFQRIGSGHVGHIVYYSRPPGTTEWIKRTAPGRFDVSGHPRLEITEFLSQETLYLTAYTCGGVFAVNFGYDSARLGQFTRVTAAPDCRSSAVPLQTAAIWQGEALGELHVIVPDARTAGRWDLMSGDPGERSFIKEQVLPRTHGFVPSQITGQFWGDPGQPYGIVVGRGVDKAGHRAVYQTSIHRNSSADEVWSAFHQLASLGSAKKDYVVDSLSWPEIYAAHPVDVGLYLPPGSLSGQQHTLFYVERDKQGRWHSPIVVPRTGLHDRDLILSTSLETQALRATWERSIGSSAAAETTQSGIRTERRFKSHWQTPVALTHWWKDTPLSVTYDGNGNPHVLYRQAD